MKIPAHWRQAAAELEKHLTQDPGVVHVGVGFKWKDGKRLERLALVVGVMKKGIDAATVLVPQNVRGYDTDVVEYGKLERQADLPAAAQGVQDRIRPIPGGYSIGHFAITAGTLGTWVQKGVDRVALTNNHVGANSNRATIGDAVLQPGPFDGGRFPEDGALLLSEYARIHFGTSPPTDPPPDPPPPDPPPPDPPPTDPPKKKKGLARFFWKASAGVPNGLARAVGCPYRLELVNLEDKAARMLVSPLAVSQPWPNLIDAAICRPVLGENALPAVNVVEEIGELLGVVDLELGAVVQKTGRTTGHTFGTVESIGSARVSYGDEGVALFDDQLVIRGHGGDFSAGGDSGSAIVDSERLLGGLLFAGGGGVTIANRIVHVVAILGVSL